MRGYPERQTAEMNEIDRLLRLVQAQGHDVWIGGPASSAAVTELQESIGVAIPNSLHAFLTTYGALGVYDNFLSGIIKNLPLAKTAGGIYGDTCLLREDSNVPPKLWAIRPHEDGAYCLDISHPTNSGEFAIVNYEHGSHQHDTTLAETYEEFVCKWFLHGWTTEPA